MRLSPVKWNLWQPTVVTSFMLVVRTAGVAQGTFGVPLQRAGEFVKSRRSNSPLAASWSAR